MSKMHYSDLLVVAVSGYFLDSTGVMGKLRDMDHLDMLRWFEVLSCRHVLKMRIKLSKTASISLKVYKEV